VVKAAAFHRDVFDQGIHIGFFKSKVSNKGP